MIRVKLLAVILTANVIVTTASAQSADVLLQCGFPPTEISKLDLFSSSTSTTSLTFELSRERRTVKISPTVEPSRSVTCALAESDDFSDASCLVVGQALELSEPLIRPKFNHKEIVGSGYDWRCAGASAVDTRRFLDTSYHFYELLVKENALGICSASGVAAAQAFKAGEARHFMSYAFRVNRRTLEMQFVRRELVMAKDQTTGVWKDLSRVPLHTPSDRREYTPHTTDTSCVLARKVERKF
jgi:hypothetical protein